jgi:hypothetical protein
VKASARGGEHGGAEGGRFDRRGADEALVHRVGEELTERVVPHRAAENDHFRQRSDHGLDRRRGHSLLEREAFGDCAIDMSRAVLAPQAHERAARGGVPVRGHHATEVRKKHEATGARRQSTTLRGEAGEDR